jgi:predicted CXXCH cytochrome family protein
MLRTWLLLAVLLLAGGLAPPRAHAIPPEAKYVGEKTCIKCHDVEARHFGHTVHASAFRQNPRNDLERRVCEACHGPGSLHAERGSEKKRELLVGFTRDWGTPVEEQNGMCLNCHKGGARLHWDGSIHDTGKLACSDCHNAMARFSATGLLRSASINETCQSCHGKQRAEFRKRSHMPVPEGKMSCIDCHSPHGSPTKAAARRGQRERRLLRVPRREARAAPLGTRAGARELPQLPQRARLEPRQAAGRRAPVPLPAVPRFAQPACRPVVPRRPERGLRARGRLAQPADDRTLVPELP